MHSRNWNLGIGLLFIAASLFALLWWIPTDVESGVLLEERRSVVIGDAMAPTMSALGILVLSIVLVVSAIFQGNADKRDVVEFSIGLTKRNIANIAAMAFVLTASLAIMVWAGPLTVSALQALGADVPNYRLLTDTVPYKYIGFAIGGFILVLGLISWIEGRVRPRAILTAIGAVAALIIVYDVPFDSLLLPPNGSQ